MSTEGVPTPSLKDTVLAKARSDIASSLELRRQQLDTENEHDSSRSALPSAIGQVDVTLIYMDLVELPEELIDIVKDEMTRISLHHNRLTGLSGLSARIAECSNLRYLVMRENKILDFPKEILALRNLELLDLKKNRIETLPEDLDKLSQLKFFSINQNNVRRIPLCVAKMNLLTKFEASDNPIEFPLRRDWIVPTIRNGQEQVFSPQEQEVVYQEETIKLKKCLQNYKREQMRKEADGQSSDGTLDTPRARRKVSGRFPIKPSISGIEYRSDPVPPSPRLPKPPPLPSKSYARTNAQLGNSPLRPGLSPLITSNERNRSNSESGVQTSVREKRMAIHVKQLGQEIQEAEKSNRLSHLRGLSHGSALQGNMTVPANGSSRPSSPLDSEVPRQVAQRRLSSLPEGKRKSRVEDPYLNLARGLVYSLLQVFHPIKYLIVSLGSVGSKRTGLERCLDNARSMLEELNRKLIKNDRIAEDHDDDARKNAKSSIQETSIACIGTFEQLLVGLKRHVDELILHSSPEYVRTLMHLLYASLIEIRIGGSKMAALKPRPIVIDHIQEAIPERHSDEIEVRPTTSLRISQSTTSLNQKSSLHPQQSRQKPLIRFQAPGSVSTMSRSPSNNSLIGAVDGIPPSTLSRSSTFASVEDEESQQFERIWQKVEAVCDLTDNALPKCYKMLFNAKVSIQDRASEDDLVAYDITLERCRRTLEATKSLKDWLKDLHVRDPALKNQFWTTATAFTKEYVVFAARIKEVYRSLPNFPEELRPSLRPVQAGHKDLSRAINASPWSHLAALSQNNPPNTRYTQASNAALVQAASAVVPNSPHPPLGLQTRGNFPPANPADPVSSVSAVSSNGTSAVSSGYVTPLPATPISAALGPAALATLPLVQDSQTLGASYLSTETAAMTATPKSNGASFERSRSVSQRRAPGP